MRKLTQNDTPFLRKTLEWFAANFPFPLDHTSLITWAEQYPEAVIEKGLSVTASWYKRQVLVPSEDGTYRYATACMRNIDRARATAEKLLGGVQ
jgi:hypothetical protein